VYKRQASTLIARTTTLRHRFRMPVRRAIAVRASLRDV
jgi:hypothetical protein